MGSPFSDIFRSDAPDVRETQKNCKPETQIAKKYFFRNKKYVKNPIELDSYPRLIFIPGFGIIGIGRTKKEAKIASDLAECNVDVISKAQSFGRFKSISEKEICNIFTISL